MSASVIVLGDVMVDVVARVDGPIATASDTPARIAFHGGGSAGNTAAWLAAAGASPVLVARVGADAFGRLAEADLRAAGVDVRLTRDRERPTGTCIVLVEPGGERSMLPDAGANDGLADDDLPGELLPSGAHLHVGGYSLLREGSRGAARRAIERAGDAGMSVSVDPSSAALLSPEFLDGAAGARLLLPNVEEAAALSAQRDPRRGARVLAERFPEVVVTLGAGGALWTDGAEEIRVDAVAATRLVDTTGAGDAFAAGLLAARLAGAGPRDALAAGCELAARAVGSPGGRPATPAPTRAGAA